MKVSLFLVVLAAVAVGYVTCSGGCKKTRTVLTYNTGLTLLMPGYEALGVQWSKPSRHRPSRQTSCVCKSSAMETQAKQADFMCLQELWFEDDMKSVLDKVGTDFPHHYSAIHSSVGKLRAQEKGKRDCRSCAAMAAGLDAMSKCANAFKTNNRVNRPGLMILSRQPLTDVQYVNFHLKNQVVIEHGYIQAKAEGTPIVCAQLAADRGYYYEVVADKSKASPALGSRLPENYKLLSKYQNDYLQNDGRCTFCASGNPLLQGKKENSDPDHVLVSGLETDVTSAKRVLDVDIKLSDHFGIQQDICLP
ncbi:hypothetical protein ACOMHN_025798 [Nucella lapillus]